MDESSLSNEIFLNNDIWGCIQIFLASGSLRRMSLVCKALHIQVWQNLTQFEFGRAPAVETLISYFKRAPKIQELNTRNISPDHLTHLTLLQNLKTLRLNDASIEISCYLRPLTQLQILRVSFCSKFTNICLADLSGLINLKYLNLNETPITNLDALQPLTNLEALKLWYNESLTPSSFKTLQYLPKLKEVTASYCRIDDSGLAALQNSTQLAILRLNSCRSITGEGIKYLQPLFSLTTLLLRNCRVTSESIQQLRYLTCLTKLNLTRTQISNPGLEVFRYLTNMKKLALEQCNKISELSPLAFLTNLESLELGSHYAADDQIIHLQNLHKLEHLGFISTAGHYQAEGLRYLSTSLTDLEMSARGPQHIPHLTNLSRLKCKMFGGQPPPKAPASHFVALKGLLCLQTLMIDGFSDSGFESIKGLPQLTKLDLDFSSVTDLSPCADLTTLTSLSLRGSPCLQGNLGIFSGLTALKYLDFSNCEGLTSDQFFCLKTLTSIQRIWLTRGSINQQDLQALEVDSKLRAFTDQDDED